MKGKQKNNSFLQSLYREYKVVISNDKTFEERLTFKASKAGIFLVSVIFWFSIFVAVCVGLWAIAAIRAFEKAERND